MDYRISKVVSTKDLSEVDQFVQEVFVPDLPDLHIFGITITPSTLHWCVPSTCLTKAHDSRDFVLKAVNSDGIIIGISIVKEEPYLDDDGFQRSPDMKELDEFLMFAENAADLPNIPGGTIELSVLSVSEEWRGKGVARRLAEESARVARSLGYAAIKMFCTSEFTAKLARGLCWREHYRLKYADYPALSGRNDMEYTISTATADDESAIENFLHDHFLPDMPLAQSFGLEGEMPPRPPSVFNLKAVDEQGNLIGLAINRINHTFDTSAETRPNVKQMIDLLVFAEREADLTRLPEKTIELRVLAVSNEWRGRGVARRLAEESAREARYLGYAAIKVCCTSEFTARLVRSLGWREIYRLAYADYPALSGREVRMKPMPPHDHLYYFYTDL